MIETQYLSKVFHPKEFKEMVSRSVILAGKIEREYNIDTIAYTGNSGSAIAYILSFMLGLKLLCIRKPTENSHYKQWEDPSDRLLEGNMGTKRYMIVDDFVDSGTTVNRIIEVINSKMKAKCMAILVYNQRRAYGKFSINDSWIPTYSSCEEEWVKHTLKEYPNIESLDC